MRKTVGLAAAIGLTALVMHAGLGWSSAQAQAGVALTGRVNSEREGAMEGVVVTARRNPRSPFQSSPTTRAVIAFL